MNTHDLSIRTFQRQPSANRNLATPNYDSRSVSDELGGYDDFM